MISSGHSPNCSKIICLSFDIVGRGRVEEEAVYMEKTKQQKIVLWTAFDNNSVLCGQFLLCILANSTKLRDSARVFFQLSFKFILKWGYSCSALYGELPLAGRGCAWREPREKEGLWWENTVHSQMPQGQLGVSTDFVQLSLHSNNSEMQQYWTNWNLDVTRMLAWLVLTSVNKMGTKCGLEFQV